MAILHFPHAKGQRLRTYRPMTLLIGLKREPFTIEQADMARLPYSMPLLVTELIEKYLHDAKIHGHWICFKIDDLDPMVYDVFETSMSYEFEGQTLFIPYTIHSSAGYIGPSMTLIRLLCTDPE